MGGGGGGGGGLMITCIIVLWLVTTTGLVIFMKPKQPTWADIRKILKRYILSFRVSEMIYSDVYPDYIYQFDVTLDVFICHSESISY